MRLEHFIKKWNSFENPDQRLKALKHCITNTNINKELVEFLEKLMCVIPNHNQKIVILLFAQKIVQQYPRKPTGDFFEAIKEEYVEAMEKIKDEQEEYDPLKWIQFELEYLNLMHGEEASQNGNDSNKIENVYPGKLFEESNDLLELKDILKLLKISKSTFDRRRVAGLPAYKNGKKIYADRKELLNWNESNHKPPNY